MFRFVIFQLYERALDTVFLGYMKNQYIDAFVHVYVQASCGRKMINEYVRECTIGRGSYGKVV